MLAGEIRQFLAISTGPAGCSHRPRTTFRGSWSRRPPGRPAGIGNVVWSLKRFFAFLNAAGLWRRPRRRPARACRAAAGAGAAVLHP